MQPSSPTSDSSAGPSTIWLAVGFVLAGLGSLRGAMICGLIVGVIEMTIVGMVSASMKEAVLFIVLFAVLVIRPQGLFAGIEAKRD